MSEASSANWSTVRLPPSQPPRFPGRHCYCCANGIAVGFVRVKVTRVGSAMVLPPAGKRVAVPACGGCRSKVRFRRLLPWLVLGVALLCLALGAGKARFGFGSDPFLSADRVWGTAAVLALSVGCFSWVGAAMDASIDIAFDGYNVRYSFRERAVAEQFAAANGTRIDTGAPPPPSGPEHDPDALEDYGDTAIRMSGDED